MARSEQRVASSSSVLRELHDALEKRQGRDAIESFARILRDKVEAYNWVGVYLVHGNRLELEAYAGDAETQHVSIPIGQGVCGAAAQTGETILVPDVREDPRYLMCFPSTRSEIVVPVKNRERVLGEIDIDSDKLDAFGSSDKRFLEEAARILAASLQKD